VSIGAVGVGINIVGTATFSNGDGLIVRSDLVGEIEGGSLLNIL